MGYAVYHMEKGKGGSGGIGKHIDRKESINGYTTFEHHNRKETKNNKSYILNKHCEKSLPQAIKDRIKEGYKGEKAIRKDAVRFQTHILTGGHEEMKAIFADKKKRKQWIESNKEWMQNTYGKENIVRFVLHVDEKTPHIHVVTVPMTQDGRLSAKEYANGKIALRNMQTSYANKMEQFDLKRGLERTGISHETATEYYARQKEAENIFKKSRIEIIVPKKTLLITTNAKEITAQNRELAQTVLGLISENKKGKEQTSRAESRLNYEELKVSKLEKENNLLREILANPEKYVQFVEQKKQREERRSSLNESLDQEERPRKRGVRR